MSTLISQQKLESFSFKQGFTVVTSIVQLWLDRHHQRKQLATLEASQLVDMGFTKDQVTLEMGKPFWK